MFNPLELLILLGILYLSGTKANSKFTLNIYRHLMDLDGVDKGKFGRLVRHVAFT